MCQIECLPFNFGKMISLVFHNVCSTMVPLATPLSIQWFRRTFIHCAKCCVHSVLSLHHPRVNIPSCRIFVKCQNPHFNEYGWEPMEPKNNQLSAIDTKAKIFLEKSKIAAVWGKAHKQLWKHHQRPEAIHTFWFYVARSLHPLFFPFFSLFKSNVLSKKSEITCIPRTVRSFICKGEHIFTFHQNSIGAPTVCVCRAWYRERIL